MKTTIRNLIGGLALWSALILLFQPATVRAQGTAFTYQGRLEADGAPYSGAAEMQFSLWDAASGGTQLGSTLTVSPVQVSNGLFTVSLDFGAGVFTGPARWLEIAARTNSGGVFATLSPRQPVTAAPYAVLAGNVSGVIANSSLPANPSFSGTVSGGSFSGSGAGLTGLNASQLTTGTVPDARLGANVARTNQVWLLGGNAGTTPGTHFLGTTDNLPLEVRVNNRRALRLEPNANNAPNVIGGYAGNYVSNTVMGATIGGGGAGDWFGAAYVNRVLGDFGTVGGGGDNTASGDWATVGGGVQNTAAGNSATVGGGNKNIASGLEATVGGGAGNTASGDWATVSGGWLGTASGGYATVGGGQGNTASSGYATVGGGEVNAASGGYATVGGGYNNTASGEKATVGGGDNNTADGISATVGGGSWNTARWPYATVGGGYTNTASDLYATVGGGFENTASSEKATVGGGDNNTADGISATVGGGSWNTARWPYATVGGGYTNTASGYRATVGGGQRNTATGDSATVGGGWANTASGERATVGGGYLNTASGTCAVVPGGRENVSAGIFSFAAGRYARANHSGSFVWSSRLNPAPSFAEDRFHVHAAEGLSVDYAAQRPDGGGTKWVLIGGSLLPNTTISTWTGAKLTDGGVWTDNCDRHAKENFTPVDPGEILERVTALPVQRWNYKAEGPEVHHIGPVAQDFHAAFGTGADDKHLAALDSAGVALAAIQGLNRKVEERSRKLEASSQESAARIQKLEAENAALQAELAELKQRDAENAELQAELAELKQLVRTLAAQGKGGGQ